MESRSAITRWKRAAVAAALAYALVLQALVLSFGGALHAAAAQGPQEVICTTGSASGPDHAPAKAHDGLCCAMGCHGSAPAGPVAVTTSFERLAPVAAALGMPGESPVPWRASTFLPVGSRAPPRLG